MIGRSQTNAARNAEIVWRWNDGQTVATIAAQMGLTRNTAKSVITIARKRGVGMRPPVGNAPRFEAQAEAIFRRAAEAGAPCPTNAQVAEELGSCDESVYGALVGLQKRGALTIERRGGIRRIIFSDGVATNETAPRRRISDTAARHCASPKPIKHTPILPPDEPDTRDFTARYFGDPLPHQRREPGPDPAWHDPVKPVALPRLSFMEERA